MSSVLLQAFENTNTRVPVWFMRQAGRYLPEYQAIRRKHTLDEMFDQPEIAAEVTCLPVDILDVDAAILFADILTLPKLMGFDITFDKSKGPLIANPIQSLKDLKLMAAMKEPVNIGKAVRLIKQRLPEHIPLIGFAGGPFTVLSYLMEGGSSVNFQNLLGWMGRHPDKFHTAMREMTQRTIEYLKYQVDAGIDVYQIFDSWAGILRPSDYAHFVLPYVQEIFRAIQIPSIYFVKNTAHLLPLMVQSESRFLSVDHTVVLGHNVVIHHTDKGIQGNLFNGLLFAEDKTLIKEVRDVLIGARECKKFIFNLSHGVLPDTPVEKLKLVVDTVKSFPWTTT